LKSGKGSFIRKIQIPASIYFLEADSLTLLQIKTVPKFFSKDSLTIFSYFFLCVAQYFDFPVAGFLHFFPFVVLALHVAFFAFAMFPPYLFKYIKLFSL